MGGVAVDRLSPSHSCGETEAESGGSCSGHTTRKQPRKNSGKSDPAPGSPLSAGCPSVSHMDVRSLGRAGGF